MDSVSQEFTQQKAEGEILGNAPWKRHARRDLKKAADAKNLGAEELESDLDSYAEQDIPNADERDLPPSTLPTASLLTHWQCNLAMLFDSQSQLGRRAVESQETQRREYIEEQPYPQRPEKLNLNGIIGADQYGPCHVEEQ